jgi:hypothetical protein
VSTYNATASNVQRLSGWLGLIATGCGVIGLGLQAVGASTPARVICMLVLFSFGPGSPPATALPLGDLALTMAVTVGASVAADVLIAQILAGTGAWLPMLGTGALVATTATGTPLYLKAIGRTR